MIFDKQNLFSEDQAITVTADSSNIIDLGAAGADGGVPIDLFVKVTTAFAGGTSLAVTITASAAAAMTNEVTLFSSGAVAVADLVAGYEFRSSVIPHHSLRYIQAQYTVVGVMSDGAIFAGLALARQTNNVY
jgi:hypothetical protein